MQIRRLNCTERSGANSLSAKDLTTLLHLKRRLSRCGPLCALALTAHCAYAQIHKVQAPEKVTRSIGVYEWTGDVNKPTAARLIPVSLFIDSHFEDGGLYLARPVPFTLGTGNEYSVERAGQSIGLFNVQFARDVVTRRSANDDDPVGAWYGYGHFGQPAPLKKSSLKASVTLPAVAGPGDDDDSPHFVRRAGSEDDGKTPAKPESTPKASDGPKLGRRGDPSAPSTTTDGPAPPDADDPDRPTLRHRDPAPEGKQKKQKAGGSVIPMDTSLNDDPDRPKLRRGVPDQQQTPQQLAGTPPNLHQAVAVSDASTHDAHVFTREWDSSSERHETLNAAEKLARPLIAAYLATNKLQPVTIGAESGTTSSGPSFAKSPTAAAPKSATNATNAAKRTAVRKNPVPANPEFSLTDEQIAGYELSYGGLATFVYTAEVPVATGGPVYVTLVTQRLPSGDLQTALSSVTDATHLNRVPWMRPVDVVDPDASHRASLLMELRAQSSRQFALYRLVTAKAEQQFVTGVIE
jgi:hypothetical protein